MKKRLSVCALTLALAALFTLTASAETAYGGENWQVTFTQNNTMESSFKSTDLDDVIYGLQPGDNAVITLSLTNSNENTTDWYMTNEVLSSLEDSVGVAGGGAYTYILKYTNPAGQETTLFSSDTVGGETIDAAGEGLHEATNALKDYFYLDTLTTGQSGTMTLEVALDGETQGNSYQDTLADLQMNFAVELHDAAGGTGSTKAKPVKTGDESHGVLAIVIAAVMGCLLLVLGLYGRHRRKRDEQDKEVR